jgi:prepilin-type N-terminal cleavage/methylation domain-containing protein
MKTEIKAKYLQFLANKNQHAGFTLIELLVVIIIIGILSSLALPSFLSQATKARMAEAKTKIGGMNRAQQVYFVEQQTFTTNINELAISINNNVGNFSYSAAPNLDITTGVTNFGDSKKSDFKSYAGAVFYATGYSTTILCEAIAAAAMPVTAPISNTDCGTDARQIK